MATTETNMNAREFQDLLLNVLEQVLDAREDADDPLADLAMDLEGVRSISTFEDRGLLTRNQGLVVEFEDGTEFQVAIVQSA